MRVTATADGRAPGVAESAQTAPVRRGASRTVVDTDRDVVGTGQTVRMVVRVSAVGLVPVGRVNVYDNGRLGTTGGAVAGAMITGAQVKDGSLSGRDVANGSLTGTDVANNSVAGADVKDGSITSADLADEARMWGVVEGEPLATETGGISVAATTINTPKGYVQITAGVDANDNNEVAEAGGLVFMPAIDGNLIEAPHFLEFQGEGRGATGSVTVVVPVTAGSHTVDLVVFETGTGSVVYSRELSIVYAPAGTSNAPVLTGRKLPGRIARR